MWQCQGNEDFLGVGWAMELANQSTEGGKDGWMDGNCINQLGWLGVSWSWV